MTIKLPLGTDSFEKLRIENYYYVDKTDFIYELLRNPFEVNLITRPRRFGKTLLMSMLEDFFDISKDSSEHFAGLHISEHEEVCAKWMNQYPTLFLSMKSIEGNTFEQAYGMMKNLLMNLCITHSYLAESSLIDDTDLQQFEKLKQQKSSESELKNSLYMLMRMMYTYYGKPVILLIDEYDVPLSKANDFGYYNQMLDLIRSLLGIVLKTNPYLQFSIVTGCLKISKESIFTGTNNLVSDTVSDNRFSRYLGFTQDEVTQILADSGFPDHAEEVKDWYDGYRFGKSDIYCPWDLLCHIHALQANADAQPQTYWANTSGNSIVRRFLYRAGKSTQREIEQLIAGESISKKVSHQITYNELEDSIDNLWSVLYSTGYLTQRKMDADGRMELSIPNREVKEIFISQIQEWYKKEVVAKDPLTVQQFFDAFKTGNTPEIQRMFNRYLIKSISIRDTAVRNEKKENFYHGILHGIFRENEDWIVHSNAESGEGYSDILVEIEEEGIGLVVEMKYAENDALEKACADAMKQIEQKKYISYLQENGIEQIYAYGIACYRKHCMVVCQKIR